MINKNLNIDQKKAVLTNDNPLRIVAGAGTGKTTVITEKISYLINKMQLNPKRILAITFTNKAAEEMRKRIGKVISSDQALPVIKTYHSFCAWFLRKEISLLKFNQDFIILDSDDQKKLIKKLVKEAKLLGTDYSSKKLIRLFSNWQMQSTTISELEKSDTLNNDFQTNNLSLYKKYIEYKINNNVLDFNDLILKTNEILSTYPDVVKRWEEHFDYILVDEFQDTSYYQYNIIKALSKNKQNLCVVGDPDQTIYSWRGANVEIILNLEKDFPKLITITLKENYRSPQKILTVANKLIKNNKIRLEKELFSSKESDLPILYYQAFSAEDEARWTINEINKLQQQGTPLSDIVVLYRVNSLSLYLEQILIKSNIKYQVIGNINFFARQEIKDLISYLWVVVSGHDFYLERIINVPRRSIGPKSWKKITDFAAENKISYFKTIMDHLEKVDISNNCMNQISKFVKIIKETRANLDKQEIKNFRNIIEKLYIDSGYENYLTHLDEKQLVTGSRKENVKELFQFFQTHFDNLINHNDSSLTVNLRNILSDISLLSDSNDNSSDDDFIKLMTVHHAKGLEFPYVFLIGLNEEVLPHALSLPLNIEEERRIAYVAITRAQKQVFITSATRFAFDKVNVPLPVSRFINEIKPLLTLALAEPVTKFNISKTDNNFVDKRVENYHDDIRNFVIDDIVQHNIFGLGTIVKIEDDIITISFKYNHGIKSFLKNHKSIKKVIK